MSNGNCPNCGAGMVQLLFSVVCRDACERKQEAPVAARLDRVILRHGMKVGAPEGWTRANWIDRNDPEKEDHWFTRDFLEDVARRRTNKPIRELTLDDLRYGRDSEDGDAINIILGFPPKGHDIEYRFD